MDFLKNLAHEGHSGSHDKPHDPAPAAAPQREDSGDNIFEKIGDALKGQKKPPTPPPPPPKPEGLFDKISDVLHGGHHEEPPKPQTLGDKIGSKVNDALGGGARGEAEEGHLDKEHVLKEGQQKDESALEQAKDKQIAGTIRHGFERVTGKELPSHKKE
ncbi:hypothetical protein P691DRAFT_129854 [Macrolepiota fuliginosa MF-IS2]|uniref:Uncharacterized protein n=1 Tax=Macrolepiota fuliginosa MF-IS2 TaxID=1400762 RepID=A0A9P5WWK1_9AGAR|nr:hypothetical protein P691DRAFT_129854 [Macrolepiota fuliginosa MF-IS2]